MVPRPRLSEGLTKSSTMSRPIIEFASLRVIRFLELTTPLSEGSHCCSPSQSFPVDWLLGVRDGGSADSCLAFSPSLSLGFPVR